MGMAFVGDSPSGAHFSSEKSGLGALYSNATWIDHAGVRTDIAVLVADNRVILRVPKAVVDSSEFPATLDPVVGAEFAADVPVYGPAWGPQIKPVIGHSALANQDFLVVWQDARRSAGGGATYDIWGTTVTRLGAVVQLTGRLISPMEPGIHNDPAVTWDSYLQQYVVVYEYNGDIYSVFLGGSGGSSGAAQNISQYAVGSSVCGDCSHPDIVYSPTPSGDLFAVVFQRASGAYLNTFYSTPGSYVLTPFGSTVLPHPGESELKVTHSQAPLSSVSNYFLVVSQLSGAIYSYVLLPNGTVSTGTGPGNPVMIGCAGGCYAPTVAWFQGAGVWVVTSELYNLSTSDFDVYATAVDAQVPHVGLAGSPYAVATGVASQLNASITGYGASGTEGLVSWLTAAVGSSYGLVSTRVVRAVGTALTAPYLGIATGGYSQLSTGKIVAHSDDFDRYLVVWGGDLRAVNGYANALGEVYGALVSFANAMISASGGFLISQSANEEMTPAVEQCNGNYLVAWTDYRNDPQGDIYGTLLNSSGAVIASNIPIAATVGVQAGPRITCDKVTPGNGFFVVWQDFRGSSYDIWGQSVDATTGALRFAANGVQVTSASATTETTPAVAYGANVYVVSYIVDGKQIEKIRINPSTGAVIGGRIVIQAQDTKTTISADDVVCDGTRFFVVWQSVSTSAPANYDIRGSIGASGTPGTPFGVETAASAQRNPRVEWNGTVYIVVFEDDRNIATSGTDIYARPVATSGAVQPAFVVAATSVNELNPAITQRKDDLLEVSYMLRSGTGSSAAFDTGVWGQSLSGTAVSGSAFLVSDGSNTREQRPDIACAGSQSCIDFYAWFKVGDVGTTVDRIMGRLLSY